MATLTAKLTLSSSNISSDALNVTVNKYCINNYA